MKIRKWLNFTSAAMILAVLVLGAYFISQYMKAPAHQVAQNSKSKLPSGSQTFQIVQAAGKRPIIYTATINPPDVHVGDRQTLSIIVSDPSGIDSVEAQIETDHSVKNLPLNYVRQVQDSEIPLSAYSVDKDNHLVINNISPAEKVANAIKRIIPSTKASNSQKLLYQNSWIVEDTHDTKYHTTFAVKNKNGDQNTITLAWSDACSIPRGGAWNLSSFGDCTTNAVDGVDNGSITISTYTLTVGAVFAFNDGQTITIQSGSIAIGASGSIVKTFLWERDADLDRYGTGSGYLAQDTTPGSSYKRRNTVLGTDCNDGNANIFQNIPVMADLDRDSYVVSPGKATQCVGANMGATTVLYPCTISPQPGASTCNQSYKGAAGNTPWVANCAGPSGSDSTNLDSGVGGSSGWDSNDTDGGGCP